MAEVSSFLSQHHPHQATLCCHASSHQPSPKLPPGMPLPQAGNIYVHCPANIQRSDSNVGYASWGKDGPRTPDFYSFRPQQLRNKDLHCTALEWQYTFKYFSTACLAWESWAVDGKSPQIQQCPLAALVTIFFHCWFPFELRHSCHSLAPNLVAANWFSTLLHNWSTGLIGTIRTTCYKLLISFVIL